MESESFQFCCSTKLLCQFCKIEFSSTSTRNRHVRNFHPDLESMEPKQAKRIMCPMCTDGETFSYYVNLIKHLTSIHSLAIEESTLYFRNVEEFQRWRSMEHRNVNYVCHSRNKLSNGDEHIYYNCNRTDSKGYTGSCMQRKTKSGGSIRIRGTCPSRICVNIPEYGPVMVKFVETHVGHTDELRTKRLSKAEQNIIVEQLAAGVSKNRIIENSKKMANDKLDKINVITRENLAYLTKKYNVDKKIDTDDMIVTALKIKEWKKQGKNHVFLFKKIDESYPGLNEDDFAVGYMNGAMEKKLREFSWIICVDKIQGTNRRNFELTVVFVHDRNNVGFPVAFLLSNRSDQTIHEIFFSALRSRLGVNIDVGYIMSDDDPKYYNAWIQVMTGNRKPRRLISTWYVLKNLDIHGKSNIKKEEIRQEMRKEMRRILTEIDFDKFKKLKQNYLKLLEQEGEHDFLEYLQEHYFKDGERVMMWAHSLRVSPAINANNKTIETLSKLLKYNKASGRRNLRVEGLLNLLDELLDEKMWERIINNEKPVATNHQQNIALEASKKAAQLEGEVELLEVGEFKVERRSTSDCCDDNKICDEECKSQHCNVYEICLHKYPCPTTENAVISLPAELFDEKTESDFGSEENCVFQDNEPTPSHLVKQDDSVDCIQENLSKRNLDTNNDFEERRKIALDEICTFGRSLDESCFNKFMVEFRKIQSCDMIPVEICKKRKIDE